MTPRRLARFAPLALAVLAACGSSTPAANIRFQQPSAVAVFNGITVKNPGVVHPYAAVANAGRSDVTIVDAIDGRPVVAPVVLRSLAVPTVETRPSILLSASLGDDPDASTHRPDLLVAIGASSSALEQVRTWGADGTVTISSVFDLATLPGLTGSSVQVVDAIVVKAPAVDPTTGAVLQGRARIIAALSGRRLAVIDYDRAPTGGGAEADAIVKGTATVETLPFQPLSLAIDPDAPSHLYAATLDPLPGAGGASVFGVAQLDATLTPGSWAGSLLGLDARAPTRLVAAATVEERKPESAGNFPSNPPGQASSPFKPAANRVYAVLDRASCGVDQRIDCGIAVLDPDSPGATLVPDYAGEMPYLAPIFVPAEPVAFAISRPPAVPIDPNSTTGDQYAVQYMKLVAGTGVRATSRVAAVAAGDGRIYLVDLSRWQIPSDVSILRDSAASPSRTRAAAMQSIPVVDQEPNPKFFRFRELGVWDVTDPAKPQFSIDAAGDALSRPTVVRVTPGYTPSDVWRIKYQGTLPGLALRNAETGSTGAGTWLALQLTSGGTPIDVVRLYDPSLAVHVDDIVIISVAELAATPQCSDLQATSTTAALNVETRVAAILAPTAAYPGGAVVVEPLDGPSGTTRWRDCFNAALAGQGRTGLKAEVIAGGYVMVGDGTGYAGRPAPEFEPNVDVPAFGLAYQNEDALSCPILPWPATLPAAGDPFYACTDATCRAACESLVLARKARRTYHLADACSLDVPGADARCFQVWPPSVYPFPRATGPVISFRLGLRERFVALPGTTDPVPPATSATTPVRNLELDLTTLDAVSPTFRRAPAGTGDVVFPSGGITPFDRSPYNAGDSYRFYVTFGSDFVLDFSPAQSQSSGNVLR